MTVHNLLFCHHEPFPAATIASRVSSMDDNKLRVSLSPSVEVSFDWSDFPVLRQLSHAELLKASDQEVSPVASAAPNFDSSVSSSEWTSSSSSSSMDDDDMSVESCPEELPDLDLSSRHQRRHTKSVSFDDNISVREYSRTVGDHPFCGSLPLALGWEFVESHGTIDDTKALYHVPIRLNYYQRRSLLRNVAGLSEDELKSAEARHDSYSGQLSCQLHHVATASELFQSADC